MASTIAFVSVLVSVFCLLAILRNLRQGYNVVYLCLWLIIALFIFFTSTILWKVGMG